jgi:hypothetical protein
MKGMVGAVVLGSLLAVSAPGAAEAQARGYVRVGGGINLPIGDLKDVVKAGWLGQVVGGVKVNDMFGVRVDGTYGQSNEKSPGTEKIKFLGALADVTVSPKMSGSISPYVLAGAGFLNSKDGASSTAFAWNAGAGIGFAAGSLGLYLEARFLSAKKNGATSNMIPITVGVQFGGGAKK